MPFPEAATRLPNDVGHLEGGSAHRFARLLECLTSSVRDTSMASSGLVVSASLACPSNSESFADPHRPPASGSRSCAAADGARLAPRCLMRFCNTPVF
jgi:hypothetical protein